MLKFLTASAVAAVILTPTPAAALSKPAFRPVPAPLTLVCVHRKTGREMPLASRKSPQVRCFVAHRPIGSGR